MLFFKIICSFLCQTSCSAVFCGQKRYQLIGGYLDEAPMLYKDLEAVIDAQCELVEVLAKFTPKIVQMADSNRKEKREA